MWDDQGRGEDTSATRKGFVGKMVVEIHMCEKKILVEGSGG